MNYNVFNFEIPYIKISIKIIRIFGTICSKKPGRYIEKNPFNASNKGVTATIVKIRIRLLILMKPPS